MRPPATDEQIHTWAVEIGRDDAEGGRRVIPMPKPPRRTLTEVDATFRRWLGAEYDLDALHVVLAAAAAERLDGDPCWLLMISGPGNAKTETVQSLIGAGAMVVSTVSSEAALLSATPRREKAKDATGGLLRQIGAHGILVVKDVTSILAMNRDTRAALLAAFREIHDGHWTRVVGAEGGRSLSWQGRIVVIGACTTAWDTHHEVIASLGDRFIVVRLDSAQMEGRYAAGRRAIANTGHEETMRAELSAVVGGLLAGVTGAGLTLTHDEQERILGAANVVTLGRTGVTYDYRGDVVDAHAPEAPTRFAKELAQIVRGAVAIGVDRTAALRLALRCARDSMPPLRLAILEDVAAHPHSRTHDVRARINKPRMTVDRQLQGLHMLGLLDCDEHEIGEGKSRWYYSVSPEIDLTVIRCPVLSVDTSSSLEEEKRRRGEERRET